MLLLANFLTPPNAPSVKCIQSSLENHGFRLKLSTSWNTKASETTFKFDLSGGYVAPAGRFDKDVFVTGESGFCDVNTFIENEGIESPIGKLFKDKAGDRSACLYLVCDSEPEPVAVGYMISYCLMKDFDALCFDADLLTLNEIEPLSIEKVKTEIDFIVGEHLKGN